MNARELAQAHLTRTTDDRAAAIRHDHQSRDAQQDVTVEVQRRSCRDARLRMPPGPESAQRLGAGNANGPRPGSSSLVRGHFPSVREGGLEPPRSCDHWHLKPARLPIPPLARAAPGNSNTTAPTLPIRGSASPPGHLQAAGSPASAPAARPPLGHPCRPAHTGNGAGERRARRPLSPFKADIQRRRHGIGIRSR